MAIFRSAPFKSDLNVFNSLYMAKNLYHLKALEILHFVVHLFFILIDLLLVQKMHLNKVTNFS